MSHSWKMMPGLLLLAIGCASTPEPAAGPSADSLEDLRKEITTLKAGQAAMRRQLAEIKNLVEKGGAPAARRDQVPDVTLDLAGYPARGQANAVVTVVEFSDFQ